MRTRREGTSVILVSIDTLRRDRVSVYNHDTTLTPNIARLARDSIVFENAISVHTNTVPAHATMLTGRSPLAHGAIQNGIPVASTVPTMAELLHGRGFRTAAFVSGAVLRNDHSGLARGFDVYDDDVEHTRIAAQTFAAVERWLGDVQQRTGRLFLFFHMYDAHYPYASPPIPGHGPARQRRTSIRKVRQALLRGDDPAAVADGIAELEARYETGVAYDDYFLGQLLDELDRLGIYDDALIIFLSDHGETLTDHAWTFDHGGRVYDEQIRVPLLVKLPGGRSGGTSRSNVVSHLDVLPTVLDVLGLDAPKDLEGRSLVSIIDDEHREEIPAFSLARRLPQRVPEYPGTLPPQARPADPDGLVMSVRDGAWKLVNYAPGHQDVRPQLYNLSTDPDERIDLAERDVAVTDELSTELEQWRAERIGTFGKLQRRNPGEEISEQLRALGYVD